LKFHTAKLFTVSFLLILPNFILADPAASDAVAQGAAQRLSVPPGFKVSVFASGLGNARGMAFSPEGDLYVCDMKGGRILELPDPFNQGFCAQPRIVIEGLDNPHSLVFHDGQIYVGETSRVSRFIMTDHRLFAEDGHTVTPLPPGGRHFTRTLAFGPDGKLYISIGSTCDTCEEPDPRYASICRCDPDGSAFEVYAKGLRNAVGIAFRPGTTDLWASCNARDYLGDDLPPETFYLIEQGKDYGWPYSYSLKGKVVPDPDMGHLGVRQNGSPIFEYQAHTAPLGITFYSGQAFPQEYSQGLFVCFHGSWNRSIPVGYKVVFFPLRGNKAGKPRDFLWGFLQGAERVGRPVDVLTGPHGELFVSDDHAGRIFKITYTGN
jgi:glucose/arabinose dehydrogenase